MEALIITILRTLLAPAPITHADAQGAEVFVFDVFTPIELLREGHEHTTNWSPKATITPDDREMGYVLAIRPDVSAPTTAATTTSSDVRGPALTPAPKWSTEQSAFGADPTATDAYDHRDGTAGRRSGVQLDEDEARLRGGSSPPSSNTSRGRPSNGDRRLAEEDEGEPLPPQRIDLLHRAAFLIWVSAHFLSSRSPQLLPALTAATSGPPSASGTAASAAVAAPRTARVPAHTVELWCQEFQRARNRDVLFCDALCVRPWDVIGVETETIFLTARDRRIQALTLAVESSATGATPVPSSPHFTPQLSSSAFAAPSGVFTTTSATTAAESNNTAANAGPGAADEPDIQEYCFAFHSGGLTRFVTALRSLLPPRIVRDMMLQQAASVSSIQVTQASAATSAARSTEPTVTGTAAARSPTARRAPPPPPPPTDAIPAQQPCHPNAVPSTLSSVSCRAEPLSVSDSDGPTPNSGRGSQRRHGTWKAVSKWANASLQKMKDSWQVTGGNPLQGPGGEAGEESDGDMFAIPTSAALTSSSVSSQPASSSASVLSRHADPEVSLVPVLTVPPLNNNSTISNSHTPSYVLPATCASAPASTTAPTAPSRSTAPPVPPSPESPAPLVPLSEDEWLNCFMANGSLDPAKFERARKKAFYGGVMSSVRQEVWLYLLGVYPTTASTGERLVLSAENAELYARCSDQWQSFTPEQLAHFQQLRSAIQAVDKDVARTDRNLDAYRDDKSAKLQVLQRVLLAHVMLNFDLGYCQGMSDVLSPLTLLCDSEETIFLLFRSALGRAMRANFSMDNRTGMPARLRDLQAVVRHFFPQLYEHLRANASDNMMFCFRWVLMLYKREFATDALYKLWDVIFAAPADGDFDLVVAAGLLKGLGSQLMGLRGCDRIVMFANNLNGNVSVEAVIWYAHDFYNQMCVEHARLASLRAGSATSSVSVAHVSVHSMAALCIVFDGPLPREEL